MYPTRTYWRFAHAFWRRNLEIHQSSSASLASRFTIEFKLAYIHINYCCTPSIAHTNMLIRCSLVGGVSVLANPHWHWHRQTCYRKSTKLHRPLTMLFSAPNWLAAVSQTFLDQRSPSTLEPSREAEAI